MQPLPSFCFHFLLFSSLESELRLFKDCHNHKEIWLCWRRCNVRHSHILVVTHLSNDSDVPELHVGQQLFARCIVIIIILKYWAIDSPAVRLFGITSIHTLPKHIIWAWLWPLYSVEEEVPKDSREAQNFLQSQMAATATSGSGKQCEEAITATASSPTSQEVKLG